MYITYANGTLGNISFQYISNNMHYKKRTSFRNLKKDPGNWTSVKVMSRSRQILGKSPFNWGSFPVDVGKMRIDVDYSSMQFYFINDNCFTAYFSSTSTGLQKSHGYSSGVIPHPPCPRNTIHPTNVVHICHC